MKRVALMVVVLCSAFGCGGDDTPTAPTPASSLRSLAGTWSGSISDPVSGEGTARVSLREESPAALIGSWSATFRNGETYAGIASAYPLESTTFGISLLVAPPPPCATGFGSGQGMLGYLFINLGVTSRQLTATASRTSCSGIGFGSVALSKE
jgi:hypothetical protein